MSRGSLTALLLGACWLAGCGSLLAGSTRQMLDNMLQATLKQRDPALVRDGAPAYLLLVDGLLEGQPDNPELLAAAAQLYSAYGTAFLAGDRQRARLMADKARDYALSAYGLVNEPFARLWSRPLGELGPALDAIEPGHTALLALVVTTWAQAIKANAERTDALADLPKIQALAEVLLRLDPAYRHGTAHLVLGLLATILPPALGGRPEQARAHFEAALALASGNLQAYLLYAQSYARLVYDRELHDRLLAYVLAAPVDLVPELTLLNTLAKEQAAQLMASADEYF